MKSPTDKPQDLGIYLFQVGSRLAAASRHTYTRTVIIQYVQGKSTKKNPAPWKTGRSPPKQQGFVFNRTKSPILSVCLHQQPPSEPRQKTDKLQPQRRVGPGIVGLADSADSLPVSSYPTVGHSRTDSLFTAVHTYTYLRAENGFGSGRTSALPKTINVPVHWRKRGRATRQQLLSLAISKGLVANREHVFVILPGRTISTWDVGFLDRSSPRSWPPVPIFS